MSAFCRHRLINAVSASRRSPRGSAMGEPDWPERDTSSFLFAIGLLLRGGVSQRRISNLDGGIGPLEQAISICFVLECGARLTICADPEAVHEMTRLSRSRQLNPCIP